MIRDVLTCPLAWSMVLGGLGLWLLLPATVRRLRRTAGWLLVAVSVGLLFAYLPPLGEPFAQGLFWALGGMTLISAAATVTMRAPVYSAVWFSVTLLMTAGLLLMQQAQFLAIATIAVYAGAILVMFLFVLMLAQPEGHTFYDRITWGALAPAFAVLAAVIIVGGIAYEVVHLDAEQLAAESAIVKTDQISAGVKDSSTHMAGLGGALFGPHLIAVEVAGTLLLVALVGALAIIIHSRPPRDGRSAQAARGQGAMVHE